MSDMQGKVVLITGASNGIGRAAALALAQDGRDSGAGGSRRKAGRHDRRHDP